ncbi:hypothetical protein AUC43_15285 [Hymenobacter sedentarius]|uniref:Prohead serine protease domain-containing protein n=1 Tax=Hymenobacter sedentarius TaxID=1411621 RepID=A0A0U3SJI0_9BACT|nr:HK97 family phage prohead protease [Hymenobacter sedentarius]ALW86326.1 hypothetical protein AUC43_15285 [Hymenobacter sedentarius]
MFETKKAATGIITDVDTTGRRIVLYAADFNSLDSYQDVIKPGAFAKTIQENRARIKHLMHHNTEQVVGRPESIVEDMKGLLVTSIISDTQLGRDLLTLVADGVLTENSIGYTAVKSSRDESTGTRTLQEIKLYEYSTVTWGANENAGIVGIKSLTPADQQAELFKQLTLLQKSLRHGNISDETCALLEIKALQIQQAISDLLSPSLPLPAEPVQATQALVVEPVQVKLEFNALRVFQDAYKK